MSVCPDITLGAVPTAALEVLAGPSKRDFDQSPQTGEAQGNYAGPSITPEALAGR